eukprot:3509369-Amphidinium_carterae.1
MVQIHFRSGPSHYGPRAVPRVKATEVQHQARTAWAPLNSTLRNRHCTLYDYYKMLKLTPT